MRANRCVYDTRLHTNPSLDYGRAPKTNITEGGDAFARLLLRIRDIHSSATWIKERLLEDKNTIISSQLIENDTIFSSNDNVSCFAFGEIEGPEGDIKSALFIDKNHTISFHLRTPAFFIAQAIPEMLLYCDLSELAVLLISLGITAEEIDK